MVSVNPTHIALYAVPYVCDTQLQTCSCDIFAPGVKLLQL